jgi:hypothetical protein
MSMRRILLQGALVASPVGCRSDDIDLDSTASDSLVAESMSSTSVDASGTADPSTSVATDSSSSTTAVDPSSTGGDDDSCSLSRPCETGWCVAPYADNQRGAFACIGTCVELDDPASWCFDASACCDPAATCSARGYCVVATDEGSGSSESSSGGDTTG